MGAWILAVLSVMCFAAMATALTVTPFSAQNGNDLHVQSVTRKAGMCENGCSQNGRCLVNQNCECFKGLDGYPEWTGPDCSLRTCPRSTSWASKSEAIDNMHADTECSDMGICDRTTGTCNCFPGYEGTACQRTSCPNDCSGRGTCWPLKVIAERGGFKYEKPWDSEKHVGCVCDKGFRGPSCELRECPTGDDPLDAYGATQGRDCSGRGICNYQDGTCSCFAGFYGSSCQKQLTTK